MLQRCVPTTIDLYHYNTCPSDAVQISTVHSNTSLYKKHDRLFRLIEIFKPSYSDCRVSSKEQIPKNRTKQIRMYISQRA